MSQDPKFQLYKSSIDNQFYFRLKAKNGEIILSGEGYTTKQNAQLGIESVKKNALIDVHYELKDKLSNYTFNLKAANGEIIGRSENYTTAAARQTGMASVKKNASDAAVEDLD
ncbi:UPF0339 protein YegP [Flavobacterium noncentrifugens]|uniref:DUF1508 domain-containing protein n=1 Tax=Flavobacterium noncentrifugens TaxID=1128970 RepID=A0A1G8ZNN6_9FLAO|nr:YegP family protein [Flavobacterium noncentrifugens]GEP51895.1 UPF0339 protein YegP [Flavobacterium noncentrifugens]SDK16623.1 hypothetical protein SAMN04487935_2675 [Flavobacterium noncentrifugens]